MCTVLIVDDAPGLQQSIQSQLQGEGVKTIAASSANAAMDVLAGDSIDAVLVCVGLCDRQGLALIEDLGCRDWAPPIIATSADATSETAIEALKLGAFDFLPKPIDGMALRAAVLHAVETHRRAARSTERVETAGVGFVGGSAAMQEVFKSIGRVATQNVAVLIRGETGTGKELVARSIVRHSARANKPLLAVNCAALADSLLESELFGHEKGSFTGADARRPGKFEQASGGTLLLDEVGDMSHAIQAKVLRLLQEQSFQRMGGSETVSTDVRIIAATHHPLERMIEAGTFRSDLYYRLNGFSIWVPPLREHLEDIPQLVGHFIACFEAETGRRVPHVADEVYEVLAAHSWPGNVRELEAAIRQALVRSPGSVLVAPALPASVRRPRVRAPREQAAALDRLGVLIEDCVQAGSTNLYAEYHDVADRMLLARVLKMTDGNQSEAARILGITRGRLRRRLRWLHLSIEHRTAIEANQGGACAGRDVTLHAS